jgi:mRNA-degrading endonuclease toxin of MazEF toxin-antitoxin module
VKAWDIYSYQPPGWDKPHPAVIVSHPLRVANKPEVEIVLCSSQRATRPASSGEVVLDEADGLNWATLCKCGLIHNVPREALKDRRGQVGAERRRAIIREILVAHDWFG